MTKFHIIAHAPLLTPLSFATSHTLIALDGAAAIFKKYKKTPQIIIGDMDSITTDALKYFAAKGSDIIQLTDQNGTDLDKGLKHALSLGAAEIIVSNALGGRLDHTIYNYRILKKYYKALKKIAIINGLETIRYFENETVTITAPKNSKIAVLSCPKAVVTSSGLLYDMQDRILKIGSSESSSNMLKDSSCKINIRRSALIIYSSEAKIKVN